ncbi:DUF1343 domain-containing protein [Aureispira]|nr:DUF1343 domain-containing protein [Aureispira sp.]
MANLKIVAVGLLLFGCLVSCSYSQQETTTSTLATVPSTGKGNPSLLDFDEDIIPAANQIHEYQKLIDGKRLGLVINQTSIVGPVHLVDTLWKLNCKINKIFAPEHGFRGKADAGATIKDGLDVKTGVPIVSLYGKNKKPNSEQLKDIDLMIFDVQDVGVRFYTYTSTMTYVMQACAENNIPLLILDRPNPNGHYVDGPVLQKEQKSFVGLHPVPIVHGLTVAEYAKMINEEGWLGTGLKCQLFIVKCLNYNHKKYYELPVKPSPNLPNMHSIYLYPSLCLFEGTSVSVGRGTNKQFQIYGHPSFINGNFNFKPSPHEGAKKPKHNGLTCNGYDLSNQSIKYLQSSATLNIDLLLDFYNAFSEEEKSVFFRENNFFNLLSGNKSLQDQIKSEMNSNDIRQTWEPLLTDYKKNRKKYLLYPDFE